MSESETADRLTLTGQDNHKRPRQEFADKIASLDGPTFVREAAGVIYMSAFAANNPRSDYHWQADACYSEAARRGDPSLYERAWKSAPSN